MSTDEKGFVLPVSCANATCEQSGRLFSATYYADEGMEDAVYEDFGHGIVEGKDSTAFEICPGDLRALGETGCGKLGIAEDPVYVAGPRYANGHSSACLQSLDTEEACTCDVGKRGK